MASAGWKTLSGLLNKWRGVRVCASNFRNHWRRSNGPCRGRRQFLLSPRKMLQAKSNDEKSDCKKGAGERLLAHHRQQSLHSSVLFGQGAPVGSATCCHRQRYQGRESATFVGRLNGASGGIRLFCFAPRLTPLLKSLNIQCHFHAALIALAR